jgi:hypothetical protein
MLAEYWNELSTSRSSSMLYRLLFSTALLIPVMLLMLLLLAAAFSLPRLAEVCRVLVLLLLL